MPSVRYIPSCDGCAHDAEEWKDNAEGRVWSTKCSQGKTGRHLHIFI